MPEPEIEGFDYLLEILFSIGPFRGELPLEEANFEAWERRRGIELEPWEAETVIELSKAYMSEMYAAKELSALCPWERGQSIWKYVMDQKHKKAEAERKQKEPDGNRKRHRNSPPG